MASATLEASISPATLGPLRSLGEHRGLWCRTQGAPTSLRTGQSVPGGANVAAGIGGGWDRCVTLEVFGEVRLVKEAYGWCDVGCRPAVEEEFSGLLDSFSNDVCVGRDPVGGCEASHQVRCCAL